MAILLASARGSVVQFVLVTLPFFLVLLYFLYLAYKRPSLPIYNLPWNFTEEQWQEASDETGTTIRLMDILTVFLSLLVCWTIFTVYMVSFVPKRRHLIGKYLKEGVSTVGDIVYDENSRGYCGRFNGRFE